MGKALIIAEKPSVARDLARALGKVPRHDDYYENEQYVISSAIGHLVELFMPEDIDKKLRMWRLETLPIIPEKFQLKPIDKTKAKFSELKKLMARKDVETVINACDAGREGELIFTYLYELAKCKKPVQRLWMQSMTPHAIREAFAHLRKGEEMQPLQDAARSRSEADWLIGINGTRAVTGRMYGNRSRGMPATVGRVQTPTLTLVVERERQIHRFKPRPYWRIIGSFQVKQGNYEGVYEKTIAKKSGDRDDRPDRLWQREEVEKILEEARQSGEALLEEKKKRTRQVAPRLYDLTTLQREANGRFGFSAKRTLQIAQALYERHKLITYPRTDSKALPQDYLATCRNTLDALEGPLAPLAQTVLKENWVKPNRRIFNNAQVSDHFAIIPTGQSKGNLSPEEEKVFDMIARRFIAIFYPDAEFDVTTRISQLQEHRFFTEGKVLAKAGWLAVYGKATQDKESLPALCPEDGLPPRAQLLSLEAKEEATKPPPHYNEATLLSAMESAGKLVEEEELADAMKEKGLGTPATRAQTIEHLIHEKYLERAKREILPTVKAESLLDFLNAVKMETLTSPTMTGEWEHKLRQIETGQLSRADFMKGIAEVAMQMVERTKAFKESEAGTKEIKVISPTDNKPMIETLRTYQSQDGAILIYKTLGNRKLEEKECETLVTQRLVGPLEGFRSKAGKPFSASLRLNEENKVEFVFDNTGNGSGEKEPIDLSQCSVVGKCPKCSKDDAKIYQTPNSFICEHALAEKKTCDFRINRKLLGQWG